MYPVFVLTRYTFQLEATFHFSPVYSEYLHHFFLPPSDPIRLIQSSGLDTRFPLDGIGINWSVNKRSIYSKCGKLEQLILTSISSLAASQIPGEDFSRHIWLVYLNIKRKIYSNLKVNAFCFRYLATGCSFKSLAFWFSVSDRFCNLFTCLHHLLQISNASLNGSMKSGTFQTALGSIDGKHCRIKCPFLIVF